MTEGSKLSYGADIKRLFREKDINAMRRAFDLSNYRDVYDNADNILKYLANGRMPCDGAWPAANVELFRKWIADGKLA